MAPGTPTKADRSRRRAEVAESIKLLASLDIAECSSAIDDSDDVDDDYAKRQKSLTRRRRIEKRGGKPLSVQDALPFKVVPIVLPLSLCDLESVVAIQSVAFTNVEHRTPRETLEYRLRTCPGLCFGLFCTVNPSEAAANGWDIESLHTAHDVETGRQNGAKHVLLAYVVGTRAFGDCISDEDMTCPEDWKALNGKSGQVGNQKAGRTIAIHSVAVVPKLQRHGLGKLIIKAYIQHMNSAGMGDRAVLRCQPHETSFFSKFGFIHRGPNSALSGGTGFQDMIIKLPGQQTKAVAQKKRA